MARQHLLDIGSGASCYAAAVARRAHIALAFLALLFAGCGEETRLAIHLELPSIGELDPLRACNVGGDCEGIDLRLARFSLRIDDGTAALEQSVPVDEADLTLGNVPLGRSFDLRLSAETTTGQILGLGMARNVSIEDDPLTLSLVFRKPIAFLGTATGIAVIDAAASGSANARLAPIPLEPVVAMASAPNGSFIASATASRLVIHRTLDHLPSLEIPLNGPAHRLRVSPSGRYLFVMQRDRLSAVDLLAEPLALVGRGVGGTPSEIAFEDDGRHAWLLVDGIDDRGSCSTARHSKLVRIEFGGPQDASGASFAPLEGQGLQLGYAVADLLLHPPTRSLVLAKACDGEVISIEARTDIAPVAKQLSSSKNALDLALADDRVLVVTKDALTGSAAGQVLLIPLGGGEERLTSLFSIPPVAMPMGTGPGSTGRFYWVSEPTDELLIHGIEIAPDGQRALLLYRTRFVSDLVPAAGCQLALDVLGMGYMVLDLETGIPLVNQLTRLDFQRCTGSCITVGGQSLGDFGVCQTVYRDALRGQGVLSSQSYEPRAATLLFGGY